MENKHHCIFCSKPLSGRSDKKYCNDYCKSEYNNRKKRSTTSFNYSIQRINRILIQNRNILCSIIQNHKSIRIDNESLIIKGFHFNFYTHTIQTKEKIKIFCYDIGYIKRGDAEVIIYKNT